MPTYQKIIFVVSVLAMLLAIIAIFKSPLKVILKLLFNTLLGFVGLLLFNQLGNVTGVYLGLNLVNAVMVGVLGVPGLALLLIIKWIFAV